METLQVWSIQAYSTDTRVGCRTRPLHVLKPVNTSDVSSIELSTSANADVLHLQIIFFFLFLFFNIFTPYLHVNYSPVFFTKLVFFLICNFFSNIRIQIISLFFYFCRSGRGFQFLSGCSPDADWARTRDISTESLRNSTESLSPIDDVIRSITRIDNGMNMLFK